MPARGKAAHCKVQGWEINTRKTISDTRDHKPGRIKFFYCITLHFWDAIWTVAEHWKEGNSLVLLWEAHKAEALNQHLEIQKHACAKCSSLVLGSHYLWEGAQNTCRSFPLPKEYFEMSFFDIPIFFECFNSLASLPDETVLSSSYNLFDSKGLVNLTRVKSC